MTPELLADYRRERQEQRLDALGNANQRRHAMAEFKEQLKTGPATIDGLERAAEVVLALPDELAALKIEALITSVRGMGKGKTRDILRRAKVAPTDRLRDLTPSQRMALVIALRVKAATYRAARTPAPELAAAA